MNAHAHARSVLLFSFWPVLGGALVSVGRDGALKALERAVDVAARGWVDAFAAALVAEGRSVSGGWPGTISEARHWVSTCAAARDTQRFRATPTELEQLARRAYSLARETWLTRANGSRSHGDDALEGG